MEQKVSWSDFEKKAQQKAILLYGTGAGLAYFCRRYEGKIAVNAVIDGDRQKQGMQLGDLEAELYHTPQGLIKIQAPSILDSYDPGKTVVLIASGNKYHEIISILLDKGFQDYFVISLLKDYREEETDPHEFRLKTEAYASQYKELPLERKKVTFYSYRDYSDHEKYISEALSLLRPDLDIVWLVDSVGAYLPDRVRRVLKRNWKKVLYEMETAAVWVSDLDLPEYLQKRRGQIYIQTKHWAGITLKKFYFDTAAFKEEPQLLRIWEREKRIIDYIVVGSEFDKESCRRGFRTEHFIMAGSPRTDAMFHEERNKKRVYSHYHIDESLHMLLYAPTYRFDKERGKGYEAMGDVGFAYDKVIHTLKKRFDGEWIIAIRMHPAVADALKGTELPEAVIDVSAYDDSEELVSAADITVSDFSSIMFEPAFVKKPVFLFAKDLEDYLKNEYDLLIAYDTLPFAAAETTEQLCDNILKFDKKAYEKRVETFLQKYGVHEDGRASERVAGFISGWIDSEISKYE